MMAELKKVLFLCTGNSARSQMAEGLMRASGAGQWEGRSGGVFPTYVHPLAIRVMEEMGIDISQQSSKSMDQFIQDTFDYIITLCDHAAASCPAFPGGGKRLHWPLEDPVSAIGTIEERLVAFRRVRDELKARIDELLKSKRSSSVKSPL